MICKILEEGEYIFDASAQTVTILNKKIPQKHIGGIYNLNTANNEAVYTGIGGKGASHSYNSGNTVLVLEHDTTLHNDTDELQINLKFPNAKVSTVNSTNGLLGAGATFPGEYEYAEVYNTVRVGIKGSIPTDGTLFFDISEDGINTLRSVPRSVSDANFTLPRILSFNDAYIKVRYVNGTTPQTGSFSIVTKYSTEGELGLNHVMGNTITGETEGQIVKSVGSGILNDASLNSTDIYKNLELMPNGGIKTGLPSDWLFEYNIPSNPSLPSGAIPVINDVLNTEPNVIDTGWYPVRAYPGGQRINVKSDQDTLVFLLNAQSTSGFAIAGNTQPFLNPKANNGAVFGADYFDGYARVIVVNNSGNAINFSRILVEARQIGSVGIFTQLDQPIFDAFPANVIQAVLKCKDDVTSIYEAPNSHKDSNGTSLVVAQGHRPSQILGRAHVDFSDEATSLLALPAAVTVYTNPTPGTHTFHLMGLDLTLDNSAGATGKLLIRDGGPTGDIKRRYNIGATTSKTDGGLAVGRPFDEPIPFVNDVYIEANGIVGIGVVDFTVNGEGYLEPNPQ